MRMRIVEEFYHSLRLDSSDEQRIADAKADGIITSYILTTKSAMNARRVSDLCLWCEELWSVDHICESAPDYNCRFTFGEEGEGVALVKVPKEALKPSKQKIVQDESPLLIADEVFDEMSGLNSHTSLTGTIVTTEQKVLDEIPAPKSRMPADNLCQNQVEKVETNPDHTHYPLIVSNPGQTNSEFEMEPIASPHLSWMLTVNHGEIAVCGDVPDLQTDQNDAQDSRVPDAQNVFDEMPLPDFIREMAQNAKVEGDKAGQFDHEQHIGYPSDEDEQKPNARNLFDVMCELENASIPAVTTIEHESTMMPTLIKVITKPFLQFAEIDNRLSSSDKTFGNVAWGPRLENATYFEHNYDMLSADYVKTEVFRHDSDASIPKMLVWFQPCNLSRLISFVNFGMYALQVPLLSAAIDLKLIVFDPGGYLGSLVVPVLDDGHKLICLFTNTLSSMYYIDVCLVTTHVSELLDCILSITLEDKGVLKGKEDTIYVGLPCRLHHTIFLWLCSTSSWINILTYVFNRSGLHCQCALLDDYSHSFWLFIVISLAFGACQRSDRVLTIHGILCTVKLGGKHRTTNSGIFMIMTISSHISVGEFNGNHDKYIWSLSNILNIYFNSIIIVRTLKNLLLLTNVFDMSILCPQWSGHLYNSCLSLALCLTWCVCKGRSDISYLANLFKESSTMAWCMTYVICLKIAIALAAHLYPPKPLQQGLRIAEFECGKRYGKFVDIASFLLIIVEISCFEVLIFPYKAYWLKLISGHTHVDIPGASVHFHAISSSTWLIFATYTSINEVTPTNGISQSKTLYGVVCLLELLTSEYVSKGTATIKVNVANLRILLLGSITVRLQWKTWKPGLLLLYCVQIYAHVIFVFDPGGWYKATCLYLAVRLCATKLILEDKDHFIGWVMIHTKISWRAD